MGVGGQHHASAALPPGKRHDIHCTEGWLGPRAGLDGCWKISPPPGFDPPDRPTSSDSLNRLSYRGPITEFDCTNFNFKHVTCPARSEACSAPVKSLHQADSHCLELWRHMSVSCHVRLVMLLALRVSSDGRILARTNFHGLCWPFLGSSGWLVLGVSVERSGFDLRPASLGLVVVRDILE
jgi:hypothetical protein